MEEAVDQAAELIRSKKPSYIVTPNAEIAYECLHDENLRETVNAAALIVPDGAGVVLASKILRTPLKQKVAGVELAENLLPELVRGQFKLFLFGAKPGVADRAAETMRAVAPGLQICGTADGYYKDDQAVVARISAAGPDVVFVCLGAPKQEYWMRRHAAEIGCTLIGLGGTLDVFAGEAKRAPALFVRLNLEWFYRLLREPKRFVRMLRLPKYLFAALCAKKG